MRLAFQKHVSLFVFKSNIYIYCFSFFQQHRTAYPSIGLQSRVAMQAWVLEAIVTVHLQSNFTMTAPFCLHLRIDRTRFPFEITRHIVHYFRRFERRTAFRAQYFMTILQQGPRSSRMFQPMLDQFMQTPVEHKPFEIILSFLIASIDELLPLPWWATHTWQPWRRQPSTAKKVGTARPAQR